MNVRDYQHEFEFFAEGATPPPVDERMAWLSPENPDSPYHGFIGNPDAVNKLIRMDCIALGRWNHVTNDLSVALLGGAGVGKTDLARRHNRARRLPLVEVSPKAVTTVKSLFDQMARVAAKHSVPFVEHGEPGRYILPPMDVFVDEVHALSPQVVQGLLKATEPEDAVMATEDGKVADCKKIHWIIATTDRGRLFDAFDTRFTKVFLRMYSKEEVARIIQAKFADWTEEPCMLAAHYASKIPREAIAFAKEMKMEHDINPHRPWADVAAQVATENRIDPYGMTFARLDVLKAMANGPVSEKHLHVYAGVKPEELEKFVMPWLLESAEGQQPLVRVTPRGRALTEAGLYELEIRNIPFQREKALAA